MYDSSDLETIDVHQLSLGEWLALLKKPPRGVQFIDYKFPTDTHRDEYLTTISNRSEEDVLWLLHHFLIPSGSLGIDSIRIASLVSVHKSDPDMFRRMMRLQYNRRLLKYALGHRDIRPWEGVTWILDLLPPFPKQALEGLNAYILAHAQELPDGRFEGLSDAETIIRGKFIGLPGTQTEAIQFLEDLPSRSFECLVERLYHRLGYETELTRPQKDGGRDIIAVRSQPARLESLRIECKRYSKPIGVEIVRGLLGVVADEKATKGVVVTNSRFTSGAKDFARQNSRLELIDGEQLVLLMNEHLGPRWPLHVDRLILDSQKQYTSRIA